MNRFIPVVKGVYAQARPLPHCEADTTSDAPVLPCPRYARFWYAGKGYCRQHLGIVRRKAGDDD